MIKTDTQQIQNLQIRHANDYIILQTIKRARTAIHELSRAEATVFCKSRRASLRVVEGLQTFTGSQALRTEQTEFHQSEMLWGWSPKER